MASATRAPLCLYATADVGPCDADIPRWYYSELPGECGLFAWGGCNLGLNNFVTQADCEENCGN